MKTKNSFKGKKPLFLIATAVLVIAAATVALVWGIANRGPGEYDTVLTIGGQDVAYGEFLLSMDNKRAEVTAYFQSTYRLADDVYLWDSEVSFGGENPLEVLKQRATDDIKLYKYEQKLMLEYKTVDDISFKSFVSTWEADMKERAENKKNGVPVYGPVSYTKAEYYKHLHNIRKEDLREAMYKESGLSDVEYKFTDLLIEERKQKEYDSFEITINHDVYDRITY